MVDINFFTTQITQSDPKVALSGGKALSANGLGNGNFLEAILGNLEEALNPIQTETETADKEQTQETLKSEKADLALLQLALLGQDPTKSIDEKLAELSLERLSSKLNSRAEQLTKLIDHLTNGIPMNMNEGSGSIEELVARLEKRLEKLESSLDAFRTGEFGEEGAPFQLLIATGLNPNQITKITSRIEEVEAKLGRELTVEDLIAGVGNIIPAPGDKDHELSTLDALDIVLNNDESILAHTGVLPSNENIGRKTGGEINNNSAKATPLLGEFSEMKGLPEQRRNAAFNALFSKGKNALGAEIGNAKGNNISKANFSNLLASLPNLKATGDITLPSGWLQQSSSLTPVDGSGFDIQTGMPFNPVAQAAHAATSISQAGQTHAATQMVTAHISKAAQKGESGRMVLQLDPPELGRVEIKLEFGHDKSVKAHLVVEKPETLLMLQRDTTALERALQNAGLDTDSGSLNYEMADDNYAFNTGKDNDGNNHSNHANGTHNDDADSDDEMAIETTMTWDVDPETGHVHYNLLA